MIELRWKMGRANKGSPEIPQKLQYRYREPKKTNLIDAFPPEDWEWSEWMDVPKQFGDGER